MILGFLGDGQLLQFLSDDDGRVLLPATQLYSKRTHPFTPHSMQNAIATLEQLENVPSRKDGISEELEEQLRLFGCELIQSAGILLKL